MYMALNFGHPAKLYAEAGIGNNNFLSTEVEHDGGEFRVPGFHVGEGPVVPYYKLRAGKHVFSWDRQDGFQYRKKNTRAFKLLYGKSSRHNPAGRLRSLPSRREGAGEAESSWFRDSPRPNFTQNVIPKSFRGIDIIQHGATRMSEAEQVHLMGTLRDLTSDYPGVVHRRPGGSFGSRRGTLTQLHLFHEDPNEYFDPPVHDIPGTDRDKNQLFASAGESMAEDPLLEGLALFDTKAGDGRVPHGSISLSIPAIDRNLEVARRFEIENDAVRDAAWPISSTLMHEFGHHVHANMANRVTPEHIKNFFSGLGVSQDLIDDDLESPQGLFNNQMDMVGAQRIGPALLKHFGTTDEAEVGTAIGSLYAKTDDQEQFAEVFTRARVGHGPGAEQAKAVIRDAAGITATERKARRAEKLAASERNVSKMLNVLRRGR